MHSVIRLATWNMSQAFARRPLGDLWRWAEKRIDPDVLVLTEAKVPQDRPPTGWDAIWSPGGIGPTRRWGTVIAGRGVELRRVLKVQVGPSTYGLRAAQWPAAIQVADVIVKRKRWATVVGLYGVTRDKDGLACGHGGYSTRLLLDAIRPLMKSDRSGRVILAGDFNLWPIDYPKLKLANLGLVDLIERTGHTRPALKRCASCAGRPDCHHLWTHKNGQSPNAAVQQLDFIFATENLCDEVRRVYGGIGDFRDAWTVSDHAPVVAEFR